MLVDGYVSLYLYERKKLLLLIICTLCCILYHFSYNRLWKGVTGIQAQAPSSPDGWLSFWNSSWLFFRLGMVINGLLVEKSVKSELSIAIGSGITSRKLRDVSDDNIGAKFSTSEQSFCSSTRFCRRFAVQPVRSSSTSSTWRTIAAIRCSPIRSCATHSGDISTRRQRPDLVETATSPLICPLLNANTKENRPGLKMTPCWKPISTTSTTSTASTMIHGC